MIKAKVCSGRVLRSAFVLGAVAALSVIVAVQAILLSGPDVAEAQAGTALGLDMQPQNNTASRVAAVHPCTEVAVGDVFTADIWVSNVQKLMAWELRLDYDSSLVNLENADFNQFLVSTAPAGSIFPSLMDAETPNRYFLAAAEFNGTPDSGSGVLARLSLKAVGKGLGTVSIAASPSYLGPRLTAAGGVPIGDTSGDGIWDQPIVDGQVAVGQPCAPATPIAVPTPGPTQAPPSGSGSTPPAGRSAPIQGSTSGDSPTGHDGGSPDGSSDSVVGVDGGAPADPAAGGAEASVGEVSAAGAPASAESPSPVGDDFGGVSAGLIAAVFIGALLVGAGGTAVYAARSRQRG